MLRLAWVLAGLLLAVGSAAADELGDRVRALYRPYEKEGGQTPRATDVIRRMASRRLAALLDREEACSRRQGACNLGFDVIVNGQDYKLAAVRVSAADIRGDRAQVTARYTNMGDAFETRYDFAQEGGAWKLDDMEAVLPKDYRWRLSTLLDPAKPRKAP